MAQVNRRAPKGNDHGDAYPEEQSRHSRNHSVTKTPSRQQRQDPERTVQGWKGRACANRIGRIESPLLKFIQPEVREQLRWLKRPVKEGRIVTRRPCRKQKKQRKPYAHLNHESRGHLGKVSSAVTQRKHHGNNH